MSILLDIMDALNLIDRLGFLFMLVRGWSPAKLSWPRDNKAGITGADVDREFKLRGVAIAGRRVTGKEFIVYVKHSNKRNRRGRKQDQLEFARYLLSNMLLGKPATRRVWADAKVSRRNWR